MINGKRKQNANGTATKRKRNGKPQRITVLGQSVPSTAIPIR